MPALAFALSWVFQYHLAFVSNSLYVWLLPYVHGTLGRRRWDETIVKLVLTEVLWKVPWQTIR